MSFADRRALIQDHYVMETMANLNREMISDRQPHANGWNTSRRRAGSAPKMLAGISSRGGRAGLEPVGEQVERGASGTSESAISVRFRIIRGRRRGPPGERRRQLCGTGSSTAAG
jgi:hypothetical protein